jgi:hypothetical protein
LEVNGRGETLSAERKKELPPYKDAARPTQARDRAAVVAAAIHSIIVPALRSWLYAGSPADRQLATYALRLVRIEIAELLRNEFADIKNKAANARMSPP